MDSRPLDLTSRRLLTLAGLLSVLLIAVVVNYLLHEGGEVLSPVAAAAQRTAAMPGARLKMEVTYTFAESDQKVVGTGVGAVNARTDREWAELRVPRVGGGMMTARVVGNDRVVYIKTPELEAELPAGKQWLGMEPLLGHSTQTAFGTGAGAGRTMKALETFDGNVEEIDHQLVDGKQTTRYRTTVDMSSVSLSLKERGETELSQEYERIAEAEPTPIPLEIWVDEQGRARLVRMVQQLPTTDGGPTVTMEMRTEYLAFGAQPKIKLPPQHRVFDYTPVLRAELGMLDGEHYVPIDPPAGAKPLSVAAFHRKLGTLCRKTYARAKVLLPRSQELTDRLKGLDRADLLSGAGKPILNEIGRWVEGPFEHLERTTLRKMSRIAPPARYAADYRRYLALNATEAEWTLAGARVFELGAPKVPNSDAHKAEAKQQKRERKALARSLGIGGCEKELPGTGNSAEPA